MPPLLECVGAKAEPSRCSLARAEAVRTRPEPGLEVDQRDLPKILG
jgi:hypothetical protein